MGGPRLWPIMTTYMDCLTKGVLSPHLFGQALAKELLAYDQDSSVLLQHEDDLLLCCPSLEASRTSMTGY